jgi:hypothetical protein
MGITLNRDWAAILNRQTQNTFTDPCPDAKPVKGNPLIKNFFFNQSRPCYPSVITVILCALRCVP